MPQITTRRAPRWRCLLSGAVLLAGGCAAEPETGLTEEQFIDVVTQLRAAAAETPDPPAWQARKEAILGRAGVTDSALVAFVAAHGERIPFMLAVWDSIEARLRPPESQDTTIEQ